MIELTQGDLLRADAEALVNTVNCVGVMGRAYYYPYLVIVGSGERKGL